MQPGLRPLPALKGHPITPLLGQTLLQADHLEVTSVVWKSHWAGKALATPADGQTRRQTDGQADRQSEERRKRENKRTDNETEYATRQRGGTNENTFFSICFAEVRVTKW